MVDDGDDEDEEEEAEEEEGEEEEPINICAGVRGHLSRSGWSMATMIAAWGEGIAALHLFFLWAPASRRPSSLARVVAARKIPRPLVGLHRRLAASSLR